MAVGKSSLGRVAQSGVHAEVAATVSVVPQEEKKEVKAAAQPAPAPASAPKEKAKAAAQPKPDKQTDTKAAGNKIYAVGDALPEYLL